MKEAIVRLGWTIKKWLYERLRQRLIRKANKARLQAMQAENKAIEMSTTLAKIRAAGL